MRETATLEFKSDKSRSFLKTVSAYANAQGGTILFGVDDTGRAIGLPDPGATCLDVENSINDAIEPRPTFSLKIDEKTQIVRLVVEPGAEKPYLYKGKAYRRSDSSTVEVDQAELKRLILEGEHLNFEDLPARSQDLSFHMLEERLKQAINISSLTPDILKTLGLLGADGYNRAAELLADTNPYPGIDITRFGASINEILDRETTTNTSVLTQLDAAENMYERYLNRELIEGISRTKEELLPHEAFREAVANALIHRTWDISAQVNVGIHTDRVEVSSPGGLPFGLSEEEYLHGNVSVLRNPILAEVFFRLGTIEKFGTGVLRIREAYRPFGIEPTFTITAQSITVVLPLLHVATTLTSEEAILLETMQPNLLYQRAELERTTGFTKAKTIRLLNSLADKGRVRAEGYARARRYIRL